MEFSTSNFCLAAYTVQDYTEYSQFIYFKTGSKIERWCFIHLRRLISVNKTLEQPQSKLLNWNYWTFIEKL